MLVREGLETGDFVFHPTGKWTTLAHNLLHSKVYTLIHLAATMLLMLLALVEYPGVITEDGSFYSGEEYTRVIFPVSYWCSPFPSSHPICSMYDVLYTWDSSTELTDWVLGVVNAPT